VTPRGLQRGELRPLLAAAGAYFALLAGYYMLRSLREAFALQVGRSHIDDLFYATFGAMLVVLPCYWFLVARVARRWLLPIVYAAVALLFAILALGLVRNEASRALAAVYFVAISTVNLFMVSVFWSVMVDAWNPEAARRVFGYIAAGGSAGAIAGPLFNSLYVRHLGPGIVILLASAMFLLAIVFAGIAQAGGNRAVGSDADGADAGSADAPPELDRAVGGRALDDLRRLATSPYLLGIAGVIVAGQILGAFMYNEQARHVEAAYTGLGERAALFARIDLAVNVFALLLQSVVVGWLAARGGLRLALGTITALLTASLAGLALVPLGAVLLGTQAFRRALDYGLFKPVREMLFTVLAPASKFKSKSLIDTVLQRGGDSVGQGLYNFVGAAGLAGVAWICAALAALMSLAAVRLGASFDQRRRVPLRQ
jgi:AAA family ATP:ADP antiporter